MIVNNRHTLGYRVAVLAITACLLLPLAVKFSHLFSHHDHEVCLGENQSHLHEIDMDCEFFKFKINHQTTFASFDFQPIEFTDHQKTFDAEYVFLSSFQQLHFSLRGPPFNS
ncbi:hypothetical protein AB9K26_09810 [Psychroserpens sp. XS_ASV72]|uniref:hypothetical protein n=1 Tax=Psychroserpens sp. XS_ASV72 TaxID=3241293 RepID=UPI00351609D0